MKYQNKTLTNNIPNLLSVIRILMIPFILWNLAKFELLNAFIILLIASLTDYLDGFLARLFNATSAGGRMLDSIADKLLTISVLGMLYMSGEELAFPFVLFIAFREILVTILRYSNIALSRQTSSLTAKWKTFLLLVLLNIIVLRRYLLFSTDDIVAIPLLIVYMLEGITFLLSLLSMIEYIRLALKQKNP